MIKTLTLVVLLAISLVAVACSGDDDDTSSDTAEETAAENVEDGEDTPDETEPAGDDNEGGELDVCAAATPDEMEQIIGTAVEAEETLGLLAEASACEWLPEDESSGAFVRVEVLGPGANTDTLYEDLSEVRGETVDGLGDDAFFDAATGVLYVSDGGRLFSINVITDSGQSTDASTAVGELMIQGLP